jgi:hypothetical protein
MSVERNPNLGHSQMRAKKHRLFLIRASIVLFFLAIIIFGLAIFSGSEKIKIQTILVSGNASVPTADILQITNQVLSGRYGYLFARNNFLLFPRFELKKALLTNFKILKEINISWEKWQVISIAVIERKPHSVWCGQEALVEKSDCYFVDKDGFIYSPAPLFSGSLFVKNYSTLADNPLGQSFLLTEKYWAVFNLIQFLETRDLKVVTVSLSGSDFTFTLDNGLKIIFTDQAGFNVPFENLLTAIETGSLDLNKRVGEISYVDLRFPNRIVIGKK